MKTGDYMVRVREVSFNGIEREVYDGMVLHEVVFFSVKLDNGSVLEGWISFYPGMVGDYSFYNVHWDWDSVYGKGLQEGFLNWLEEYVFDVYVKNRWGDKKRLQDPQPCLCEDATGEEEVKR